MKDMFSLLNQARKLQKDVEKAQESLAQEEVEAESGGGLVKVTLSGQGEARSVYLDPQLFKEDDPSVLEDLLLLAFNAARKKADILQKEVMQDAAGDLGNMTGGLGDLMKMS